MAIINSFASIIGNLTADPTRGVTNNGVDVVTFTVAVNNYKKGSKDTNYYICSAYGETGETCMKKFHKGNRVFIIGELEAKLTTTRSGNPKMYLNLRVLAVRDQTPRSEEKDQQPETAETPDMTGTALNPDSWGEDITASDIPF